MTIQKIKSGRVTSIDADQFVGPPGTLFFNEDQGDLRLGDGITPGGIILSFGGGEGGNYSLPTATTTVKGGVKIDGATIVIANQIISVGTVPYSSISGKPTIPTNNNELTNGAAYITSAALSGLATETYVTTRGYLTTVAYADVTGKPTLFSGSYADLTNKPTLFSGSYADLTNKPTIPTNNNELTNGAGYITSAALSGLASETYVTTRGYITSAALSTYALTSSIPTDISQLTDTQSLLGQGGGGGGTTYITNTVENPFSFSIAGDDSTLREIANGESIKITGAGGITTSSDAEGAITITQGTTSSLVNGAYTVSLGSTGTLTVPANGIITAPINQEFQLQAKDANSVLRNEINLDPNNGTYMSVWRDSTTSFSSADWGSGSWNNEGGLGAARFTDAQGLQDFWLTGPGSLGLAYEVSINGGARTPNVFYDGNNGETYGVLLGLDAVPPGGQGTTVPITSLIFYYQTQSRINIDATGSEILLDAQSMDLDLRTTNNLDLRANQNLNLRGLGTYPVRIYTNGTTHMWEFDNTGSLTLPQSGTLTFSDNTVQTTAWTGIADYNNLINKPNLAGTYSWSIAGDDSTLREISAGESVKFVGAGGITTASDAEGNITITGPNLTGLATETYVTTQGYITSSALTGYALTSAIPTNNNQLTNGSGYITSAALTGLATESYVTSRGYITGLSYNDLTDKPNLAGTYSFNVAADDSTLREISTDETVKFIGAGGVTTASDAEGNITITGPSLTGLATETYVTTRGYITSSALTGLASETFVTTQGYITSSALTGLATETYVTTRGYITSSALTGLATESYVTSRGYITGLSYNDLTDKPNLAGTYSWSIAADDSTQLEISAGNLVKIVGAQGVTTTSNSDGQITITGPDLSTYATQSYVTTALSNSGIIVSATAPAGQPEGKLWYNSASLELYVRYDSAWVAASASFSGDYNDLTNRPTNVSQFANDADYVSRDEVYLMILELTG